jgi:hypothetical protein
MNAMFDTPLRSAALGVLIVAAFTLTRGLATGRPYKTPTFVLGVLALAMVLVSEAVQ